MNTPRGRCYIEIRQYMRDLVSAYYTAHPERLDEERAAADVAVSIEMLNGVFAILNKYDIQDLPRPGGPEYGNPT